MTDRISPEAFAAAIAARRPGRKSRFTRAQEDEIARAYVSRRAPTMRELGALWGCDHSVIRAAIRRALARRA